MIGDLGPVTESEWLEPEAGTVFRSSGFSDSPLQGRHSDPVGENLKIPKI